MTIHLSPAAAAITLFLTSTVAAFSLPACPESSRSGIGGGGNATEQTWNFQAPAPFFPALTNAPFSGQNSQLNLQLASNGAHLGGPAALGPMRYRDSLGRFRDDPVMRPFGPNGQDRIAQLARIFDPVAGYQYILDSFHQIAYRIPLCTLSAQQPPATSPARQGPAPTITDEDLGTQTMFGVTVTGHLKTITLPPGSYMNNNIAVTRSIETWTSGQYGDFLEKDIDPTSERTITMTNFSAAEPDPSLFQPPAGYQVVDKTAPFSVTIHYGNQ